MEMESLNKLENVVTKLEATNVVQLKHEHELRSGRDVCGVREPRWLASHLNVLAGTITARADAVVSADTRDDGVEHASSSLQVAAAIYRLLSQNPEMSSVNLVDCVAIVCSELSGLAKQKQTQVSFFCESGCAVPASHALAVGTVAVEVLTNAAIHAHPAGVRGTVTVSCSNRGNTSVLEIADDGVGFPEGFDLARDARVGIRTIRAMAKRIGATDTFESTDLGLVFRLKLPMALV